ncbi:MAG: YceI family protein [Bacteroidetes bacterium]|jgi:polyisoprenoid-binding protein YceI|nr:YceI family protein [Bacteroidota bacterium]MDF2450915.1 YceI family protein [Bacteroidota bacterium]
MQTQDVITKTKWAIDNAHTTIEFKAKHLMLANVKGSFMEFGADIYTNGDDFTSSEIDFWVNPASIQTGDSNRDSHLKSAEFFDVERHKKVLFVGESFMKTDKTGYYELSGELTIKGISKKIKLNVMFGGAFKDPSGNEKVGFSITGTINRSDWGLTWNTSVEKGGFLVSDEIIINCDLELSKEEEYQK